MFPRFFEGQHWTRGKRSLRLLAAMFETEAQGPAFEEFVFCKFFDNSKSCMFFTWLYMIIYGFT